MTQTAEKPANTGDKKVMTLAAALTDAMDIALARDESVVMYGEDVGVMGGVFRITTGLQAKHGKHRVFDTPLTESGIVGSAVGMSAVGFKPIVELQFGGFLYAGLDQVISHVSRYRYRSRGRWQTPMVIRFPYGGGLNLLEQHHDSPEAYLTHTPGIKVAVPSNPYDAKGLMLASIEDPDPVVFFENIKLYRSVKEEIPTGYYTVPLGQARKVTEGNDVTVIAWGAMVQTAQEAAKAAQEAGVGVDLLDLRTLVPLDLEAILESVQKTGRVVIVHEANLTSGYGGEIAALIAEHALYHLEAPIKRVAHFDTMHSPFNAVNHFSRPEPEYVLRAIQEVLEA
ncbi:pyruvate dehydrogenase E1 component beta subunit [Deinobacterium chartae]|uniref:Pyruvate dehydrogenase E1 component beta subunit n=1 Tax=Deinobacterium chartae TaxID=521158 RepID=A0A841HYT9_9DEIO|nr:alpha-ketoacid dehydrogenase subunit beta [Deinobacterium chartae]MBB6097072.1 pyruvate dehydrogenase E1 component beta subunit [Deinobacterium chartae]